MRKKEKAKEHFLLSIENFSDNALAHFRLGVLLIEENKMEQAAEHLRQSVDDQFESCGGKFLPGDDPQRGR